MLVRHHPLLYISILDAPAMYAGHPSGMYSTVHRHPGAETAEVTAKRKRMEANEAWQQQVPTALLYSRSISRYVASCI